MSDPFLGEIRMFGGNFAPRGWAFCDGSLLSISEFDALFALIGTTYGGDGQTTFGLPDLRGRIPIHQGASHTIGEMGGVEAVSLNIGQLPAHTHPVASTAAALYGDPAGRVLGSTGATPLYGAGIPDRDMSPSASVPAGGSAPHNNLMPFLCVNFIIALEGIFPSQA